MTSLHEKFTSWYLRFNGYFTIDNFVVHAADDPTKINNGIIAPYTETDTIAVRMPYSAEIAGSLKIANHNILVENQNERFDIVIAEVKSGNENGPNSVWRNGSAIPIEYMVRFVGLFNEPQIADVVNELSAHYCYENAKSRIRYIVFAHKPNPHYLAKGVKYITFAEIARFLVEVRGQCWMKSGIGVASVHYQWGEQINNVFTIAHDFTKSVPERQAAILRYLASENEGAG